MGVTVKIIIILTEKKTVVDLGAVKSAGEGVTCIATDESSSSGAVVAVAGDGGQLKLYYDHSRARDVANQQRKKVEQN